MSVEHTRGERQPARMVRSFVLRKGRITGAQRAALTGLLPEYRLYLAAGPAAGETNAFPAPAPLWMEIGFGNGDMLSHLALSMPDVNFIGVEVYPPGVGRLLQSLRRHGLDNVRIVVDDAVQFLAAKVADGALHRVLLLFSNRWQREKFRLDTAWRPTVRQTRHSRCGAWREYAEQMREVLDAHPQLANLGDRDGYSQAPPYRIETHFERRGRALGHGVWDLLYRRCDGVNTAGNW